MIGRLFRIRVEVRVHPQFVELRCSGRYSRAEAFRVGGQAQGVIRVGHGGVSKRAVVGRIVETAEEMFKHL